MSPDKAEQLRANIQSLLQKLYYLREINEEKTDKVTPKKVICNVRD